ncbi:hypothetical protein [Paludisphaera rhizosphaerae]|uniref:hypothetical protein n=1 Tax=Paludisphaera rhizosphaerae TaxID=2711216 RepID=UPI0013EA2C39|nr:hypothetical protein [Paludisphaera rhizosphaerae]
MSDSVSFSDGNPFPARAATISIIFKYVSDRLPGNAEMEALIAQEEFFDRIGAWFFYPLSLDTLRLLSKLMDEMALDLPAVAEKAGWVEERRPMFYADVERFRCKLAERIAELE